MSTTATAILTCKTSAPVKVKRNKDGSYTLVFEINDVDPDLINDPDSQGDFQADLLWDVFDSSLKVKAKKRARKK